MIARPDITMDVLADPAALAERVAEWLLAMAMAKGGAFSVALSGGSTPRTLYRRLAEAPYRESFPWSRAHWFWGDERFVPPDDALSNYRMVREAMLSLVPVPAGNIHAVPTERTSPDAAATAYERDLKAFYGAEHLDSARPLFDVVLLGLGEDGHTASLFPGTSVLEERKKWVAAVIGAKSEARITMTYPVLDSTRHVAFLVTGKEKASILARLRRGDETLPAAHVHPLAGGLHIFADSAAAAGAP
jgi:6-phosphogluconolactonase